MGWATGHNGKEYLHLVEPVSRERYRIGNHLGLVNGRVGVRIED